MTEGATAVYIALATALAVWGTIAIYLGRVGARLRRLQRDLERMPPDLAPPPDAPPREQPDDAPAPPAPGQPVGEPPSRAAALVGGNHPLRLAAWLIALEYGGASATWLLTEPGFSATSPWPDWEEL